MAKKAAKGRAKSAVSGRFVKSSEAANNPRETVVIRVDSPKKHNPQKHPTRMVCFVSADGLTSCIPVELPDQLPRTIWRELGGDGRMFTAPSPMPKKNRPAALRIYRLDGDRWLSIYPVYHEYWELPQGCEVKGGK